ncbi:hypothetical protein FQR65_LT15137 [Abscondita terminalis]|nr:hypothetical protein FQR65_LT15137 [Abscondita terminalis]
MKLRVLRSVLNMWRFIVSDKTKSKGDKSVKSSVKPKKQVKKKFKKATNEIITTVNIESEEETSESEKSPSLHNSSDEIDFTGTRELKDEPDYTRENQEEHNITDIALEKYYAVFYTENWCIGRVIEEDNGKFKIKFLKQEFGHYKWSRHEDIDCIEKNRIFLDLLTWVEMARLILEGQIF